MAINQTTLASYVYDPNKIQKYILEEIENITNGGTVVVEPTNPFTMLMEATAVNAANAVIEPKKIVRKLYPNLAITPSDLYHHLSEDELVNMFATPAEASFIFYINVKNFQSVGYRPTGANYVETILPMDTEVTVNNYPFTLFNDIVIRLYDDGGTFVEQQTNTNPIANNALGVLSSGIISDADAQPWIIFETLLKQVKKHTITETINKAEGYNKAVTITDKYYYSTISYSNTYTNNNYLELPKSHNEEYINPNIPTVYINVMDTTIGIRIPDVYMVDGNVSGNVKMEVYETKGNIFLPLTKYGTKDFKVALGDKGTSISAATIYNIVVLADSRTDVADGKDTLTTAEIQSRIIGNSTGMINTPITDLNIKTKGSYSGYDIFKTVDTITERLYTATKNLPEIVTDLIHSRPDVYFNTLNLTISEITNFNYINKNVNNIIIKSGTVFKDVI